MLGLRPGDEVLMPSYNCGTELEAVLSTGAMVSLYRVDRRGRIDVDDVRTRLTTLTRAVFVTHYFGWPQNLTEMAAFCRAHGLLLLEDCALSLLSASGSSWLGQCGDAAIFSFPKTLAVPDGGALLLQQASPAIEFRARPTLSSPRVRRNCASLLKRRLRKFVAPTMNGMGDRVDSTADSSLSRAEMPADYYWNDRSNGWGISGMTLGILKQVDPDTVTARRRANYAKLLELVRDLPNATPFFDDLPTGVCPLEFPLVVPDKTRWVAALQALGVEAIPWWSGYHRCFPWDKFPDACYLKDHVLALPVNHELSAKSMEYMARCVVDTSNALRR
jgi:dTDP-4-amino-4,6-dideoxygalactose transaminase